MIAKKLNLSGLRLGEGAYSFKIKLQFVKLFIQQHSPKQPLRSFGGTNLEFVIFFNS